MSKKWIRVRFQTKEEDFRPIKWPPVGPYWCSGSGDDYSILIAYVREEKQILEYWPEAYDMDFEETELVFSTRFPCPIWWDEAKQSFKLSFLQRVIGFFKCWRRGHKYRPWCYVRTWHGRYSNNVAKEEQQYECVCCGKQTEWMSGPARKEFLKKNKPDWGN